MKIYYNKDSHLIIHFGVHEFKAGLATLKGMAKFFKMDFIAEAAKEGESDLTVKKLSYSPHHHICVLCACEIDTRKDSYVQQDGEFRHQICPVLKLNRPI